MRLCALHSCRCGSAECTCSEDKGAFKSVSSFSFRFNLSNTSTTVRLSADSDDDRRRWVEAVKALPVVDASTGASQDSVHADLGWAALPVLPKAATEVGGMVSGTDSSGQAMPTGEVTFVAVHVDRVQALWDLPAEATTTALHLNQALIKRVLTAYNGYQVKAQLGSFLFAFSTVSDAVLWSLEVQRRLMDVSWPHELEQAEPSATVLAPTSMRPVFRGLRLCMGVHTGMPTCRVNPVTARMDYSGPPVAEVQAVADTSRGGEILCSQDAYTHVMLLRPASRAPSQAQAAVPESKATVPSVSEDRRELHLSDICITDMGAHEIPGFVGPAAQLFQLLPIELADRSSVLGPLPVSATRREEGDMSGSP